LEPGLLREPPGKCNPWAYKPADDGRLFPARQVHLAKGAREQAKSDFRSAITASPRNTVNYGTLGSIYEQEGNWDEAKKLFQSAHEIDPAAPFIVDELAFLYLDIPVAINSLQTQGVSPPGVAATSRSPTLIPQTERT
jgi:tetratricopeptide (TPR) repeat protein